MSENATPSASVLVADVSYAIYRAARYGVTEASIRASVEDALAEARRQNLRDLIHAAGALRES